MCVDTGKITVECLCYEAVMVKTARRRKEKRTDLNDLTSKKWLNTLPQPQPRLLFSEDVTDCPRRCDRYKSTLSSCLELGILT